MLRKFYILLNATAETQGNGSAKADQSDIVSQNAKLTKDLETANANLATANGKLEKAQSDLTAANEKLTAVTKERDKAQSDLTAANEKLTAVTKERDDAKAENGKLTAEKKTVDEAAAAKVASLGIVSGKKEADKTGATAEKKPSLTERVLSAQGVKTLAESETKYRERLAANPGL